MLTGILARFLGLAVCALVAFIAHACAVVICKFANGLAIAAASVSTWNLILAVLAIVSVVAVALTVVINQIAMNDSTAIARD